MPVSKEFRSKNESKSYPAIPEELYVLEITDIATQEQVSYETRNKPQDEQEIEIKLNFTFNILTDIKFDIDGEEHSTRGRIVWRRMAPFVSAPAKSGKGSHLYWIIKSVFGSKKADEMTKEEITGDFLNSMIGKQIQAIVRSQEGNNGKIYLNFEPSSTLSLQEDKYLEPVEKPTKSNDKPLKDEIVDPDDIPF